MTDETDFYSILGVLPIADAVVIRAAYKALSQRYHPDKWPGSSSEASERMSSLNQAYQVLGNEKLRAEYDQRRGRTNSSANFGEGAADEDFAAGMAEFEERWQLAVEVYPDLTQLTQQLRRVSTSLAFSFVSGLLENKLFTHRHELAKRLETAFLERYFGTNTVVVNYARVLILMGEKRAAKRLNRLVDVLGSDVNPTVLLDKVESEFGIQAKQSQNFETTHLHERFKKLRHEVRELGYYQEAITLANMLGFKVEEVGGGFFSSPRVHVNSKDGKLSTFKDTASFMQWAQQTL